jgi:hypothetical protein
VSLLSDVVAVLERAKISHALIGAAAMAVHGVSRATADVDLFTVDGKALQDELWVELEQKGVTLRLLKGDFEDPLAGSVRLCSWATEPSMSLSAVIDGRPSSSTPRRG